MPITNKTFAGGALARDRWLLALTLALLSTAILLSACGSGVSKDELDTSTSAIREDVKALEEQVSALAGTQDEVKSLEGEVSALTAAQRDVKALQEQMTLLMADLVEAAGGDDARLARLEQNLASQQQGFQEIESRLLNELEAISEAGELSASQAEHLSEALANQQEEFEQLEEQIQAALATPEPVEPDDEETGTESEIPVSTASYEVWAMDQFNNTVHVINPQLELVESVDFTEAGVKTTHWIDFTSDFEYAWIASTASGNVAVVRAEDRKVIETFDTGPSSHAADIYPDDSGVLVSVIGSGELVEIVADHDSETFSIGRTLKIAEDPAVLARAAEFGSTNPLEPPKAKPISSAFTSDGRFAYVTLGPALKDGGLVVVNLESFSVVKAYPPNEVKVNLMSVLSADGSKMYVTGGSKDTTSFVYVFDTATHKLIAKDSTRGADAHGLALTPDGSELWATNRWTGSIGIFSTEENEFKEKIAFVGVAPDLLAISPDGVFAFILLRGAQPEATGAMAGFGETPAIVVVDVATRETVDILLQGKPTETGDPPDLDYHGIAIREL